MIAKISSTENLGGALGYNFKKVEKGEASILLAAELYQDREGRYTMEDVLADMQAVIPEKCRTKKMVFHCSLNPHPDEKLSDETLTQIAKEYMETLGYGKQPYIVFKHNDIAREHIHIVSLRVDGEGKKINDRFEKRRSKQITDTLERKFGLIPSSKVTDREIEEVSKIDTTKGNIKEQVSETLRSVLKHYKFCSLGELNAILTVYNLTVEETKTEFRGKKYDGLVYVPTDDKGDKVSTPIHRRRKNFSKDWRNRACGWSSERMRVDVSMASHSLTIKWVLHSMAHAWARDMLPMFLIPISPIQQTTHSWTKCCTAVRLYIWINLQPFTLRS